jgi:predicted peroxiredoxin
MPQIAIICNGDGPKNLFPSFIMGSAAAALGDEVVLFFCPAGAPALRRGELEKLRGKGLPDMKDLVSSFQSAGGRILICELALEAKDLKVEDLRDDVEVVGVATFLFETKDAARTLCF